MPVSLRPYGPADFKRVSDFLIAHHLPGNRDGNWLQPIWEYMHTHPYLDESSLGRIGIWHEAGEIVGVAHYESRLGEAFFQVHPDYAYLKPAMLEYGDFVCFCGLWYEPVNHYAFVEPLATDPDFRRMGLARVALWEGIRRCAKLGATVVYVGSDQEFYIDFGFAKSFDSNCWLRRL